MLRRVSQTILLERLCSAPTRSTFVLGSPSESERARPVDLPGVNSPVLLSRNLNDCSYIRFTKHTDDCHEIQRRSLTRLWVRTTRMEPTQPRSLHHRCCAHTCSAAPPGPCHSQVRSSEIESNYLKRLLRPRFVSTVGDAEVEPVLRQLLAGVGEFVHRNGTAHPRRPPSTASCRWPKRS